MACKRTEFASYLGRRCSLVTLWIVPVEQAELRCIRVRTTVWKSRAAAAPDGQDSPEAL